MLVREAEYVIPGHGPALSTERALAVLEADRAYLHSLREFGGKAELPLGRRTRGQRARHDENAAGLSRSSAR